jgi:hypothetical protein
MSFHNVVNPAPSEYTAITTLTTTTIGPGVIAFDGYQTVTGAATGTVTIFDNSAASGTKLVDTASTATAQTTIQSGPQDGILLKSGYITVVTATAIGAVNVYYIRSIP